MDVHRDAVWCIRSGKCSICEDNEYHMVWISDTALCVRGIPGMDEYDDNTTMPVEWMVMLY